MSPCMVFTLPHILPSLPQMLPQTTPSVLATGIDCCIFNLNVAMLLLKTSYSHTLIS
jgi:hypothetical protein